MSLFYHPDFQKNYLLEESAGYTHDSFHKRMDPEEARKFALNYYGWDDEDTKPSEQPDILDEFVHEFEDGEELPFS